MKRTLWRPLGLAAVATLVIACAMPTPTPASYPVDRMHDQLLTLAENEDFNRSVKDFLLLDNRKAIADDEVLGQAIDNKDSAQVLERLQWIVADDDAPIAEDLIDALRIHTIGACGLLKDEGYSLSLEDDLDSLFDRHPFGRVIVASMIHSAAEKLAGEEKSDLIVKYCEVKGS